jgi:hydrogenase maturation protein HypF
MVEHDLGRQEQLLGFCFDGTGYGSDGTLWGGETMLADYSSYQRLAHLSPMPIVGGDSALRSPYRLALTYLWACSLDPEGLPCSHACPQAEAQVLQRQWQLGRFVSTSSVGRLFDAVASIIGVCQKVTFEGQAAMLLEACADWQESGAYEFDARWQVAELLAQVVADVRRGLDKGCISARFHRALARAVTYQAELLGADRVGLSGGVFQNRLLLERTVSELEQARVKVLWHQRVPTNDGGLALGQIAVAGTGDLFTG